MAEKTKLMTDLRERLLDVPPIEGEPEFFEKDETLMRFLKARDWKLDDAEKLLRSTIDWRRQNRPFHMDCKWCHSRPGYHNMRQIGFDEMGRPVIYSCFAQGAAHKHTAEDSIAHVTYLIENAKVTMKPGIMTWVFIMDCTGMSLPLCNPRLGYGVTQVMSNFYPERLGLVICLNHSPVFQGVWKAIKVFLHPNTAAKMKLVRSKKKVQEMFSRYFSDELSHWLQEEIKLNKQRPLSLGQQEFWKGPINPMAHDPRGCPSYVSEHIDQYPLLQGQSHVHKPHPNIIDFYCGKLTDYKPKRSPGLDQRGACGGDSDANDSSEELDLDTVSDIEISEEYQIPKDAKYL